MAHPADMVPAHGATPDGGYAALEYVEGITWQAVYWPTHEDYVADRQTPSEDGEWSDRASYSVADTYEGARAEYAVLTRGGVK